MNPEADQILRLSATQLMADLAPLLPQDYARGYASVLSLMLMLSAQEYGRAAEIRTRENADIRVLFRGVASGIEDDELRVRLADAAESSDTDLSIATLNEANAGLRRLLIELHAHVEASPNGRVAEQQIWDALKRCAERRLLRLG